MNGICVLRTFFRIETLIQMKFSVFEDFERKTLLFVLFIMAYEK